MQYCSVKDDILIGLPTHMYCSGRIYTIYSAQVATNTHNDFDTSFQISFRSAAFGPTWWCQLGFYPQSRSHVSRSSHIGHLRSDVRPSKPSLVIIPHRPVKVTRLWCCGSSLATNAAAVLWSLGRHHGVCLASWPLPALPLALGALLASSVALVS